jgi:hypothetical protein
MRLINATLITHGNDVFVRCIDQSVESGFQLFRYVDGVENRWPARVCKHNIPAIYIPGSAASYQQVGPSEKMLNNNKMRNLI